MVGPNHCAESGMGCQFLNDFLRDWAEDGADPTVTVGGAFADVSWCAD